VCECYRCRIFVGMWRLVILLLILGWALVVRAEIPVVDTIGLDDPSVMRASVTEEGSAPTFLEKLDASPEKLAVATLLGLFLVLFLWFRQLANKLKERLGLDSLSPGNRFRSGGCRVLRLSLRAKPRNSSDC
jgi:hypothetical protein